MTYRLHRSFTFWFGLFCLLFLFTVWFITRQSGYFLRFGSVTTFVAGGRITFIDNGVRWSWSYRIQPFAASGLMKYKGLHYETASYTIAGGRTATRYLLQLSFWFIASCWTLVWASLLVWHWRRAVNHQRLIASIPDHGNESTPPAV